MSANTAWIVVTIAAVVLTFWPMVAMLFDGTTLRRFVTTYEVMLWIAAGTVLGISIFALFLTVVQSAIVGATVGLCAFSLSDDFRRS